MYLLLTSDLQKINLKNLLQYLEARLKLDCWVTSELAYFFVSAVAVSGEHGRSARHFLVTVGARREASSAFLE